MENENLQFLAELFLDVNQLVARYIEFKSDYELVLRGNLNPAGDLGERRYSEYRKFFEVITSSGKIVEKTPVEEPEVIEQQVSKHVAGIETIDIKLLDIEIRDLSFLSTNEFRNRILSGKDSLYVRKLFDHFADINPNYLLLGHDLLINLNNFEESNYPRKSEKELISTLKELYPDETNNIEDIEWEHILHTLVDSRGK